MKGYKIEQRKFSEGDISFIFKGVDYSDSFQVERKANWNELYGNMSRADFPRLKREFMRLLKVPFVVLLIEDHRGVDGIDFIKKRNYKMYTQNFKTRFNTFLGILQWERKIAKVPPIRVIYCHKENTHKVIIDQINIFLNTLN
jgi:hypothetical protein